jgi:hypothetical protein
MEPNFNRRVPVSRKVSVSRPSVDERWHTEYIIETEINGEKTEIKHRYSDLEKLKVKLSEDAPKTGTWIGEYLPPKEWPIISRFSSTKDARCNDLQTFIQSALDARSDSTTLPTALHNFII